jgi:hypothetical protein
LSRGGEQKSELSAPADLPNDWKSTRKKQARSRRLGNRRSGDVEPDPRLVAGEAGTGVSEDDHGRIIRIRDRRRNEISRVCVLANVRHRGVHCDAIDVGRDAIHDQVKVGQHERAHQRITEAAGAKRLDA